MTSAMVNIPVQGRGCKDPHGVLTLVRGHGPLVCIRGFAIRVTKWTRASALIQSMMTSMVTSRYQWFWRIVEVIRLDQDGLRGRCLPLGDGHVGPVVHTADDGRYRSGHLPNSGCQSSFS